MPPAPSPMTIAFWMVLIAALLPLLAVAPAKMRGDYDNRNPREQYKRAEGLASRALAAHWNSYEAFPFFAAAVIIAYLAAAPRPMIDLLAIGFVLFRVGYIGAYWMDAHVVRSLLWALAWACCVGLFVLPILG